MLKEIKSFYKKTKFDFSHGEKGIPLSEWPYTWKKVFYKIYERFPFIKLTTKVEDLDSFERLFFSRRTTREFSDKPLSFDFVSKLLQMSMGISYNLEGLDLAKRTYPSAGARYPIEPYIINNNIEGLERGLYHFNVKENSLELMLKKDLIKDGEDIVNNELGHSPLLVLLTGAIGRTQVKYGANAYRFALIESGHIGQNLSLYCEYQGVGSCAIGGFDNNKTTKLLDLTEEEIPLYLLAVGKKNEN